MRLIPPTTTNRTAKNKPPNQETWRFSNRKYYSITRTFIFFSLHIGTRALVPLRFNHIIQSDGSNRMRYFFFAA